MDNTIKITIETRNAAFEGSEGAEVARILRQLADRVEGVIALTHSDTYRPRDINGNVCGLLEITPHEND